MRWRPRTIGLSLEASLAILAIALLQVSTLAFTTTQTNKRCPRPASFRPSERTLSKLPLVAPFSVSTRKEDQDWDASAQNERRAFSLRSASTDAETTLVQSIGDNVGRFELQEQNLVDWIKFSVATGLVLAVCSYAWFIPGGPMLGNVYLEDIQSILHTTDPAITVGALLSSFAVAHSGLAGLRTYAEPLMGPRAWRVVFAVVSLPLAFQCVSYFVNHAHEGTQLWDLDIHSHPILHAFLWITNFVSFLFLYPSTFNLLEIAAIEKPQLHLYKPEGIIRITRHPQAFGQVLWCLGHTAAMGTTTAVAASVILCVHHVFATYHGDRRLRTRHGDEAFEYIASQTSIFPFQAIWEGRQVLPSNYYQEFLSGPYALVVGGTIAAYFAHPYFLAGAALLGW
jgi:zeta-carotene isomerase